ncbi:MAG: glycosyltransferase [Candidatus Omnitrophota bacterium]
MTERYYSLVVMTYQRPDGLKRCLTSLAEQDIEKNHFEVLVIDDGSQNDHQSIIESFNKTLRIRYLKQKHQGIVVARNTGLKNANGHYVGFIADDYYLPPDYLSTADAFFRDNPRADVLTFNIRSCGQGLSKHIQQLYIQLALWRKIQAPYPPQQIIKSFQLPASRAAIFRRRILLDVGGFNEKLNGGEDMELTRRLSKMSIPIYFMPNFYIEHWENKNFIKFLDQRYRYGWYSFNTYAQGESFDNNKKIDRGFLLKALFYELPYHLICNYFELMQNARRIQKLKPYIILSPFILLNLFFYFLGFFKNAQKSGASVQVCHKILLKIFQKPN